MAVTTLIVVSLLIAVISTITPSMAGNNSLMPNGTECFCPDAALTFTCNILGGGATVWTGTALSCHAGGEIALIHDPGSFQPGSFNLCNGDIVGEIVGIEQDNRYISRLNFTAGTQLNNRTIECLVQDDERAPVGDSTIIIIPVSDYLQEPSGVMLSNVNMTKISLNWTKVNSVCPNSSIAYDVTSNCTGVECDPIRNEATCSNLPIGTMCTFSIRSDVCGRTETANNVITVTLRRPQAAISPVYSTGSSSSITRVMITIDKEPFFSVAGGMSGSAIDHYFYFNDNVITRFSCQESVAMFRCSIDAAAFVCQSTTINVTLSALNELGQGPISDPTTIGCTNEFVSVQYDSIASTITCNFLDEMDTSNKSCSVMYGQQCDQMLVSGPQQNSNAESPNSIALKIESEDFSCFLVTASNDSFMIFVEGTVPVGGNANAGVIIGATVGVIGVILIVAMSVMLGVIIFVVVVNFKKVRKPISTAPEERENLQLKESDLQEFRSPEYFGTHKIIEHFQLEEVPKDDIKVVDIPRDYTPKERTEDVKSEASVKSGCSFYEFEDDLETIPERRRILLMDDQTRKIYASDITSLKSKRNLKEKWTKLRELLKDFKIFVESIDSEERKLKPGTTVLYKVIKTESATVIESATVTESATKSTTESATKAATEGVCGGSNTSGEGTLM